MADRVHITKNGLKAVEWDSDVRDYVEREVASPLRILRCECQVDEGVTLGDIFRIVGRDGELVRFLEDWTWSDIGAFHEEARQPFSGRASDLKCVEISKCFEWNDSHAGVIFYVRGIGKPDEYGSDIYALDFTPTNKIAHLPVRLNPRMAIEREHTQIGEGPSSFTVLDVLGEIYWEIGFYGSPAARDSRAAGLEEAIREVDEGRATLIPWKPEDRLD